MVNGPIGAPAHLGLGRAYAPAGDNSRSPLCLAGFPGPLERMPPRKAPFSAKPSPNTPPSSSPPHRKSTPSLKEKRACSG
jgi:hypothetical protein